MSAVEIERLLARGRSTAEAGHWEVARHCFAKVLGLDSDNEEALLWLAALEDDPRQSITYLKRVLRINPDSKRAQAGLRWAQERLRARQPRARPRRKKRVPLASYLLPGLLMTLVLLCVAWGAYAIADNIEAVRAILLPPTATPTATATSTPTSTPTPTQTPSPGRIEGKAWHDMDGDGIMDTGEPGLAGASIRLCDGEDPERRLIAPTLVTGTDGAFHFAGLTAGRYVLAEENPSGYVSTTSDTVDVWVLSGATIRYSFGDRLLSTPTPTATCTPIPTPTLIPSPTSTSSPTAIPPTPMPVRGAKWIDVDISSQTLIAYEGDIPVFSATVSTGAPSTPTVTGRFRIFRKLLSQTMVGPDYTQPDVPHVMYFYAAYSIHGTYWHSDFGRARSHGCVNLRTRDARLLFAWTDPPLPPGATEVWDTVGGTGTVVVIHD